MNKNLLIGAISGNYSIKNLKNWVKTSQFTGVDRVLFYYNPEGTEITEYCYDNKIELITPGFDLYGGGVQNFITNSGHLTIENSP